MRLGVLPACPALQLAALFVALEVGSASASLADADIALFSDAFESGLGAWSDVVGTPALPGFGTLSGQIGALHPLDLDSSSPALFSETLDFGAHPYDESDFALLTPAAQEVILDGGAVGSALVASAFACEVLVRAELASLLRTEAEILYQESGPLADFELEVDDFLLGEDTARAFAFPWGTPLSQGAASSLLQGKLADLLLSVANVEPPGLWRKGVLVVFTPTVADAATVAAAWSALDANVRGDSVVVVVVTEGDDSWLYLG